VHARAARQQGVVILETIIDVDGNVTTVRVLRGYPLLDESAVEAVRQWRFTPALLNGQPIPVVMTVTVNFALR
jgi:protein TonB